MKYKFIADTDVQFFNSSVGGHEVKLFLKDEVIEGNTNNPNVAKPEVIPLPPPSTVYTSIDGKMPNFFSVGNIIIGVPIEKLKEVTSNPISNLINNIGVISNSNGTSETPGTIFTPKNIAIGLVVIGLITGGIFYMNKNKGKKKK